MRKKKKFKMKKFILWSIVVVFVLGVSGLFAANYAVIKVIESMANSLESEVSLEPQASNEVEATVDNTKVETGSDGKQDDKSAESGKSDNQEAGELEDDSPSEQPSNQVKVDNKETDKAGVYNPEVSIDKAKDIKDSVTLSEKADITSILMGNLSLSDIKLFQKMASGGMTVDEKREARKVLLDKLSPEEYNTLSQIAKKYGVSQGKTYDQAEEEEANSSK